MFIGHLLKGCDAEQSGECLLCLCNCVVCLCTHVHPCMSQCMSVCVLMYILVCQSVCMLYLTQPAKPHPSMLSANDNYIIPVIAYDGHYL